MWRLPFYKNGDLIGTLMVADHDCLVKDFIFHEAMEHVESQRALFALALAEVIPQGFSLIAEQKKIAHEPPCVEGVTLFVDRYVFVRDGAFVFRTKDGLRPHSFKRLKRSDGLAVYIVS